MTLLTLALVARAMTAACLATGGDALTAGDLARALPVFARLPAATVLGWAPAPGLRRVLDGPELGRLAAKHALALPGVPPRLCVTQPAQPLDEAALAAALNRAGDGDWRIQIEAWPRASLPVSSSDGGTLHFDRRALPRLPRSRAIVPVLWRGTLEAGHRRYPVWARVLLSVERTRLEARVRIPAGELIPAGAVALVTVPEYPLWPIACQQAVQTSGQQARRTLAQGDVITPRDLTPAPAVRRGDPLAVDAGAGAAHLQIQALAEAPARTGQIILVKNPLNGRRFPARVTSPGHAAAITNVSP